ncbi:hypothetical protein vBAcoSR7M_2 [Alteromonas phage vB_AcoS-R7M]|uniref:Uncharacterized protein n=1 Tax=Alteromonas phage vB_AcoS-R7M TaxID=2729541 RepID=A0A6M3YR60_9CAUD|nr:hypothetical protein HWD34_gp02 [Alteromonas phage vB_AcoS-R7M]QJI53324.1 hypothetical protein vBAcoSR7M_2 [Alteromonas phage vB_AcoS-R7M]
MQALTEIVLSYIHQADENYTALRKRVLERAATANNDLEPTVDKFGRLHAPCDGYAWEDCEYAGGSYLPYPLEFWEELELLHGTVSHGDYSKVGLTKGRVRLLVSEADELCEIDSKYVKFSKGKAWNTADGETCYAYFETKHKGLVSIIEEFKVVQAQELKAKWEAERAAKQALKGVAPEGRIVVKGTVLKTKLQERQTFSYYDNGADWKMLVELDNKSTVWGTIPSVINYNNLEGAVVQFTATFEQAEGDNTHAYFKRPSKASVLKFSEEEE